MTAFSDRVLRLQNGPVVGLVGTICSAYLFPYWHCYQSVRHKFSSSIARTVPHSALLLRDALIEITDG